MNDDERIELPPGFSTQELSLWEGLWDGLLKLAESSGENVPDAEVLANARTAHGPVVVTAGLVRKLRAYREETS